MAPTRANTAPATGDASGDAHLGRRIPASRRSSGDSKTSSSTVLNGRHRRRSTVSGLAELPESLEHVLKNGLSAADGWRHEYNYVALAFPLLPAIATSAFGQPWGDCVKDVLILVIAGYCLLWTLTTPWDWYHSARSIRVREEGALCQSDTADNITGTPFSSDFPNDRKLASLRAELRTHELTALGACIALPAAAAYVLHFLRAYLTYSSRALNKYNLLIFLLISVIRPAQHCITLVKSRTLSLHREVLVRQQELHELGGAEESQPEKSNPSRSNSPLPTEGETGGEGEGEEEEEEGEEEDDDDNEEEKEREAEWTPSGSNTSSPPRKLPDLCSLDSKDPLRQALLYRIRALERTTDNLSRLMPPSRHSLLHRGSRQPGPTSPAVRLRQGQDTQDNDVMVAEIAKQVAELLQDDLARSMAWFERRWDAKLATLQFMGWEGDGEYLSLGAHGQRRRLGKPPPKRIKRAVTSSTAISSSQSLSPLPQAQAGVWSLTRDVANITLWCVFLPLTLPRECILFGIWVYEKIRELFGYEQRMYAEAAALLRDPRRLCRAAAGFVWDAVAGDNVVETEVESEEEAEELESDARPRSSKRGTDHAFPNSRRVSARRKGKKQHLMMSRAL